VEYEDSTQESDDPQDQSTDPPEGRTSNKQTDNGDSQRYQALHALYDLLS